MTDSLLLRIQEHCPELLHLNLTTSFFTTSENLSAENNPIEMAKKFNLEYLGRIPMDRNLIKSCEDGISFLEAYPSSIASEPFQAIVTRVIEITGNLLLAAQTQNRA
jgi:MinD-like ATPase involved in chromosome partitioning or flagellar assembly